MPPAPADPVVVNDPAATLQETTNGSSTASKEESSNGNSGGQTAPPPTTIPLQKIGSKGKSLKERGQIPYSFYMTFGTMFGLQICSGFWSLRTLETWYGSISSSVWMIRDLLAYQRDLMQSLLVESERRPLSEYLIAAAVTAIVSSILYVFFVAPFRAGFWTGPRSRKQLVHRYMGLLYLTQYALAWVEFITNFDQMSSSFLPHFVAVNGLIQGYSAFFSFRVLPELEDAGYISDKAVLSRNFVHENIFFTVMCMFGSLYYHDESRAMLRSNPVGRVLEYLYMFWPYILIRPLFPITRFKDAGKTHKGRTTQNQMFYEVSTYLVKIFFLYAKYFLGFYFNFLLFLDLPTQNDWRFLRGCLLLNIGTVSLAVFLHTLRFRKVLPPRLTFSIYLAQIYATIVSLPFAYEIFTSHYRLMGVCLAGLLCNMTRNRTIHGVWCFCTMVLLSYPGIEW